MAKNVSRRLQTIQDIFTDAARHGVMLQTAEDERFDGRTIRLGGQELVNFGSCSYLGLELHPALREGVIDAVTRYGTQFSSSRSYVSSPLYAELTTLLDKLFGGYTMVTASTSLGHMAVLPVVVGEDDAVILDQQVHHSVQTAANLARVQGSHVEIVRHNRMDRLEERIAELAPHHPRVWYMADGVYSMFADLAPLDDLTRLMERHPKLHLYLDDAHGVSWTGQHGRGYVLGHLPIRERMVVAASLNKAFACAGGAFIFPTDEERRYVTTVGGPMIFSGPVQPPMLGAAIRSARLHLSPELSPLQERLQQRVSLFNRLAEEAGLPLVSKSHAPIRFVGVGLPELTFQVARRMSEDGLYVNVAPFPGVPMRQGGIRSPLTTHHTEEDIHRLISSLARHLPAVLAEAGSSVPKVCKAFGIPVSEARPLPTPPRSDLSDTRGELRVEYHTSIDALDTAEWDRLLGGRGSFSADGLRFLERTFRGHERREENWRFHYWLIRDRHGVPVLATFFSDTLWKDDMSAPAVVSERVEQRRAREPYYLTSHTLGMGSLLSEGEHLYLDRSRDWRAALVLLLEAVEEVRRRVGAERVVLRDFPESDTELDDFLRAQGYVKAPMLDTHLLEFEPGLDDERWLAGLSYKARLHQRREVLPYADRVETEFVVHGGRALTPDEQRHLDELYRNVQARGLDLNVFPLPRGTFAAMLDFPGWELMLVHARDEDPATRKPIAFMASFLGAEHCSPMVIGMDYRYLESHHVYRVVGLHLLRRARQLGKRRLCMGMGASLEKRRFGARAHSLCVYVQATDHYNLEVIAQLEADTAGQRIPLTRRRGAA